VGVEGTGFGVRVKTKPYALYPEPREAMVKLTVIYNLPEGADHEAFIKWRVKEGQAENFAMTQVLKTDFYVAVETPLGAPKYRYITEAYYATMKDLEDSFFRDDVQAKLKEDMRNLAEAVILISDEVVSSERS
jgi:hypothetical protein